MFVGEAPGFHEDKQGVPFVGAAGQLLGKLLAGIGLTREDVYVANVLKCRPPGNRDPLPEEIEACESHLFRQIELIRPKVVATLGNFATKLLSGKPDGITRVHGREQEVVLGGSRVLLFPIFHPAAALYTPRMLDVLEADFAQLPELLGRGRRAAGARRRRARAVERARLELGTASAAAVPPSSSDLVLACFVRLLAMECVDRRRAGGDRGARRAARGAARGPATSSRSSGELGAGQDDVRPRRLPGARRRRARHEPDVHDRPPLRRAASPSPTSTSTGSRGIDAEEWGDLEPYFDWHDCLRRVARARRRLAPARRASP